MEKMINWDAAQFNTINVMENLQVTMPDNLQEMDDSDAQDWYLSEKRPQVIYANEEKTLLCTFSIYEQAFTDGQVPIAAAKVRGVIQRSIPQSSPSGIYLLSLKNTKCGWFESTLISGKTKKTLLMYATPILGRFMLGTFVFPYGDLPSKKTCIKIMRSLQAVGGKA